MIFKYNQLRRFFTELNQLGSTQTFKEWNGESVFLVRHDVDFDIELAYNLALIENEMNIKATYFILTTCENYNVLSESNRKFLRKIIALGHEVGLHFDPTIYNDKLEEVVEIESQLLSFVIGEKVRSISLHNPTSHGQYPMFDGYINAYSSELFNDENYISDSCFSFRGKQPFNFLNNIKNGMVQILLHPMHFSENGDGYDVILTNNFIKQMNNVHQGFYAVNETYRNQVGDLFLNTFKKNIQ